MASARASAIAQERAMVEQPNQLTHDRSETQHYVGAIQQQQHMPKHKHKQSDPLWSWRESVGDDNDNDANDGDDDDDDKERELLAKASLLIVRMLSDDESEPNDMDMYDNNAEQNDCDKSIATASHRAACSSRETLLQDKLAQTLVELAIEQENLQLAASAGKALLEQLSDAKDDVHELRAQLRANQQQLQRAETEKTWLLEQQQAMGRELQQLRESRVESHTSGSTSTHHSRTPSREQLWLACDAMLTTVSEQHSVECRECLQRSAQLSAALHEVNTLKRRCLELESQQGKQRSRSDEHWLEHESLTAAMQQLQAEHDAAQRDLDFAAAQLQQLQRELAAATTARDNMRVTTRRLECDNDALTHKIEDRDEQLSVLQRDKRAAGTATQVLANRVASLELENQKLLLALGECQRLSRVSSSDVQLSQSPPSQVLCHTDDEQQSHGNVSLQQHVRDLEQLLDEAQREAAALKLDNRLLRRQQQHHHQQQQLSSAADVASSKLRRIKSMTPRTTTCADILAVDKALLLAHNRSAECLEALDAEPVSECECEDVGDHAAAPSEVSVAPSATFLQRIAKSRRRHTCVGSSSSGSGDDEQQQQIRARRATSFSVVPDVDALNPPPSDPAGIDKAPLYLGISVIACATAAAAGIFARR